MLTTEKINVLQSLVADASKEELIWIKGYLAGFLGAQSTPLATTAPSVAFSGKLSILFGTETGNAKSLAAKLVAKAKQKGIAAKAADIAQYKAASLAKEEYLVAVVSTQGDGEPPLAAQQFFDYLQQQQPSLSQLKFGVIALGDSSYPLFCKAGEDLDQRLSALGGQTLQELIRCDTDYEAAALSWFDNLLQGLSGPSEKQATAAPAVTSGRQIYRGVVTANIDLNDEGSLKQTHHIEIEAEGVVYQPGDALSVVAHNPEESVTAILNLAGWDRKEKIRFRNDEDTLENILRKKANISWLPERVVKAYAGVVRQDIPDTRISLLDLLKIYPAPKGQLAEEIINVLEPVSPRQYSIASAPEAHEGAVHLIVARNSFPVQEELRYGLCSDFLIRLQEGAELQFTIHPNHRFRLPAPDKDIIMIGPGTGIAPFRAFLAAREAVMATGRNWLFFGEQHFTTDFLYQTEIQDWKSSGVLTRFNAAFSRDQPEKVYVQHKMKEQAAELWDWIDRKGAVIYVCGAKAPMSIDVEQALTEIVAAEGGLSIEEAQAYIQQLIGEDRYLRDVY